MAAFTIRLFCFFTLVTSILTDHHPSFDVDDSMGKSDKDTIKFLSWDLIVESQRMVRLIKPLTENFEMFISFNVGMLMGRIREKYRFMEEIYRQICDAYNNHTWHNPPGIGQYRPLHFVVALERLRYLEVEINQLVDVMVDEVSIFMEKNHTIVNQKDPPPVHPNANLHIPTTTTPDLKRSNTTMGALRRPGFRSQTDIMQEEALKSVLRQRYLMKRLGNPTNMTTAKKRFLRQWPVEGSWSLDKYNYDYK